MRILPLVVFGFVVACGGSESDPQMVTVHQLVGGGSGGAPVVDAGSPGGGSGGGSAQGGGVAAGGGAPVVGGGAAGAGGGTAGSGGGSAGTGGGSVGTGGGSSQPTLAVDFLTLNVALSGPTIRADAQGHLHLVASSNLYGVVYGNCASNCGSQASWQFVVLPDPVTGLNVQGQPTIAVSGSTIHVIFHPLFDTVYARCDSNCLVASSWQTVDLGHYDEMGEDTLSVDDQGRLWALLGGTSSFQIFGCSSNCLSASQWSGMGFTGSVFHGALQLTSTGGVRALVQTFGSGSNPDSLNWLACDANCSDSASWTTSGLFVLGGHFSLALDPQDHPRIVFELPTLTGQNASLSERTVFAACDSNCDNNQNWTLTPLGVTGEQSKGVTIISVDGGFLVTLIETTPSMAVQLWSCSSNCTADASWSGLNIETMSQFAATYSAPASSGCTASWDQDAEASIAVNPIGHTVDLTWDYWDIANCGGTYSSTPGASRVAELHY